MTTYTVKEKHPKLNYKRALYCRPTRTKKEAVGQSTFPAKTCLVYNRSNRYSYFLACSRSVDIITLATKNRIKGDPLPQGDSGYRLSSARERCHAARGSPRRTTRCRRPWGWCIPPATTNSAKAMSKSHQPTTRTLYHVKGKEKKRQLATARGPEP